MIPTNTRILIADDSLDIVDLMKGYLNQLGFKNLYEAMNGEQALKILNHQDSVKEPIQLVLVDWEMPELNGIGFLKKVRENSKWKSLPIIMVTAEKQIDKVVEAFDESITHYMVKPFTLDGLKKRLQYVSEQIQAKT